MLEVAFHIPGPPVGKGRPRFTRQGHTYTPAKTKEWEALARNEAWRAMDGAPPIAGAVAVQISAVLQVPPSWTKRRISAALEGALHPTVKPDADNVIKAVLDAMNGVVYADDKQAADVRLVKRYGPIPGVHVRVVSLDVADMERRETAAREAA